MTVISLFVIEWRNCDRPNTRPVTGSAIQTRRKSMLSM
jgi:hypothetical protein